MLGDIIKEERTLKNITQEDLAKILGVSPSTVGMYEQNRRIPDNDMIVKLADFFNISTDYLLGKVPFKNESEAYYSISIASVKYFLTHSKEIPKYYNTYSGMDYMFDKDINEDIRTYCYSLLHKFDNGLHLTNLELFELSNIIFSEIKWTKDFDGIVYLKNFEDECITIRLDFENIDKIDNNKLNLENSFLLKSKTFNGDSFLKYNSIFSSANIKTDNETNHPSNPITVAAHLPEGVELTEEEQEQLDEYIQFILSRRKK